MDALAGDMSEQEVGMEDDHGSMKEDSEDSSDEEAAMAAIPVRRRLRGKQEAPEYGPPPAVQVEGQTEQAAAMPQPGLPVIKRPSMLKRPAGRTPKPHELRKGFEETACRFCPVEPGKPARVQPARGVRHCVFCHKDRMEAAHGVVRRNVLTAAVKKFLAVDKGIFQVALERIQLFLGEQGRLIHPPACTRTNLHNLQLHAKKGSTGCAVGMPHVSQPARSPHPHPYLRGCELSPSLQPKCLRAWKPKLCKPPGTQGILEL